MSRVCSISENSPHDAHVLKPSVGRTCRPVRFPGSLIQSAAALNIHQVLFFFLCGRAELTDAVVGMKHDLENRLTDLRTHINPMGSHNPIL